MLIVAPFHEYIEIENVLLSTVKVFLYTTSVMSGEHSKDYSVKSYIVTDGKEEVQETIGNSG